MRKSHQLRWYTFWYQSHFPQNKLFWPWPTPIFRTSPGHHETSGRDERERGRPLSLSGGKFDGLWMCMIDMSTLWQNFDELIDQFCNRGAVLHVGVSACADTILEMLGALSHEPCWNKLEAAGEANQTDPKRLLLICWESGPIPMVSTNSWAAGYWLYLGNRKFCPLLCGLAMLYPQVDLKCSSLQF